MAGESQLLTSGEGKMARLFGADANILVSRFRAAFQKMGYKFFENGDYNLNIVGVRNSSGLADTFAGTWGDGFARIAGTTACGISSG